MSTIFYSAEELARCAVLAVGNTSSDMGKSELSYILAGLVDYSDANAKAYNTRYSGESATGATLAQLQYAAAMERFCASTVEAQDRVRGTAGLLRYNLDDEATVDALHPIITILGNLLRRATASRS